MRPPSVMSDSDCSLEEGEIPSSPPRGYYEVVSDTEMPSPKPVARRKTRWARNYAWSPRRRHDYSRKIQQRRKDLASKKPIRNASPVSIKKKKKEREKSPDFDSLRKKYLQRLKTKQTEEAGGVEIKSSNIAVVEMEDVNPIFPIVDLLSSSPSKSETGSVPSVFPDSEEELLDLDALRAHVLSTQRASNKYSGDDGENGDLIENEFSLRAAALKTALQKKRQYILRKKHKRKEQLQDSVGNASGIENSPNVSEEKKSDKGKENQESEIVDEFNLRQQLLADLTAKTTSIPSAQTKMNVPDFEIFPNAASGEESIENTIANEPKSSAPESVAVLNSKILDSTPDIDALAQNSSNSSGICQVLKPLNSTLQENAPKTIVKFSIKDNLGKKILQKRQSVKLIQSTAVKSSLATYRISKTKFSLPEKNVGNTIKTQVKPAVKTINSGIRPRTSKMVSAAVKQGDLKKSNLQLKTGSKTVSTPNVVSERIVVQLGADSSDDDDFNTSAKIPVKGPLVDSIDRFLSEARRRTEAAVPSTPDAVHAHLPLSQRKEYMELKKKLAEKLTKKTEPLAIRTSNPIPLSSSASLSPLPILSTDSEKKKPASSSSDAKSSANKAIPITKTIVPTKQLSSISSAVSADKNTLPSDSSSNKSSAPVHLVVNKSATQFSQSSNAVSIDKNQLPHGSNPKKRIVPSKQQLLSSNAVTIDKNQLPHGSNPKKFIIPSKQQLINSNAVSIDKNKPLQRSNPKKSIVATKRQLPSSSAVSVNKNQLPRESSLKRLSTFVKKVNKNPDDKNGKTKSIIEVKNPAQIARIEHFMNFLKKELELEKSCRDDLIRLKSQMAFVEQKRKAHGRRAEILKAQVQRLLDPTKRKSSVSLSGPSAKQVKHSVKLPEPVVSVDSAAETETVHQKDSATKTAETSDKNKQATIASVPGSFIDYTSPLSRTPCVLDPHLELCQHDLTGSCRDPECTYQHTRLKR